jgi:hypothetical protein
MFDGKTVSSQTINLLFDGEHYHVITNLPAALAVGCVCPACNEGCRSGVRHRCEMTCDACAAIPPCVPDDLEARITCGRCNRQFRNVVCFENHRILQISNKTVCEARSRCRDCGAMIDRGHKYYKRYCPMCIKNRESGHRCYMAPLVDRLPSGDRIMYEF